MKKIVFSLFTVFTLIPFIGMSQLSGFAFLAGQTNHSGIKVKFNAHPGTAVSDSTTTTSTGSYSTSITGGVYDVVFSKAGYLISNYNNGATIVLTNSVVLNNDTLKPGNQVNVSGNVCGNWTNNNTYIVTGSITVPTGCTLTIQPGTVIKFNSNDTLTANGVLIASGTTANPILFTSNLATQNIGDWYGILAHNSSSIIDNCIIEYCNGMDATGYNPIISNNVMRNSRSGVYCNNCSPHIFNNKIYNLITPNGSIGIWVEGTCNAVIECNELYAFGTWGCGIITNSNLVRNNIIHDINEGIQSRSSNSRVENNYLYNCNTGIAVYSTNVPYPVITNNTINSSTVGIYVNGSAGTNASIINNIITNNQDGISQYGTTLTGYTISNNLVWNSSSANYNNVQVTGIGQIVGTNTQGNAIDSYYNMSQDPLFAGGTAPALSSSSPCLNAGDVTYSNNIGFNTSYTCTANVVAIKTYNKQSNLLVSIYPNPNNGSFVIEPQNTLYNIHCTVYDVNGKLVLTQTISGKTNIDASSLNEGVYNISIISNEGVLNNRLVIVK